MNKKIAIFGLIGAATLILAGCTIPGVPSEAVINQQTQMLTQMQQDMQTLLSGVESLRIQNEALTALLSGQKMQDLGMPIHGAADDTGAMIDTGISVDIPLVDTGTTTTTGTVSTGSIKSGTSEGQTSPNDIVFPLDETNSDQETTKNTTTKDSSTKTSLLEELRKANEKSNGSGATATNSGSNNK